MGCRNNFIGGLLVRPHAVFLRTIPLGSSSNFQPHHYWMPGLQKRSVKVRSPVTFWDCLWQWANGSWTVHEEGQFALSFGDSFIDLQTLEGPQNCLGPRSCSRNFTIWGKRECDFICTYATHKFIKHMIIPKLCNNSFCATNLHFLCLHTTAWPEVSHAWAMGCSAGFGMWCWHDYIPKENTRLVILTQGSPLHLLVPMNCDWKQLLQV